MCLCVCTASRIGFLVSSHHRNEWSIEHTIKVNTVDAYKLRILRKLKKMINFSRDFKN